MTMIMMINCWLSQVPAWKTDFFSSNSLQRQRTRGTAQPSSTPRQGWPPGGILLQMRCLVNISTNHPTRYTVLPPGSPLANRRSIEGGGETSCWSPVSSPLIKRRSVEIGSPLGRRKQEVTATLEPGGLEVGRARDSGNLQPVLLLASLDKSILQIRLGNELC